MYLYTHHDKAYWDYCVSQGRFVVDIAKTMFADDDEAGLEAYEWMRDQMALRIPNFSGSYPIWAYVKKPDLRYFRWTDPEDTDHVMLTLDVPEDRVLLSNFEDWHSPLNAGYLFTPEQEASIDWQLDYDEIEKSVGCHTKEDMHRSWERIFDTALWGDDRIQACIDDPPLDCVKHIRHYRTGKRKDGRNR